MNKDLEFLDDFVTNNAARGLITMGYYIKLKTAIEHLELELDMNKDAVSIKK